MSNNKILVPQAEKTLNTLKGEVMSRRGYLVDREQPHMVKYEVANNLGIPLQEGYNGELKAKDAGAVGGTIGGNMVREMIKQVELQFARQNGY